MLYLTSYITNCSAVQKRLWTSRHSIDDCPLQQDTNITIEAKSTQQQQSSHKQMHSGKTADFYNSSAVTRVPCLSFSDSPCKAELSSISKKQTGKKLLGEAHKKVKNSILVSMHAEYKCGYRNAVVRDFKSLGTPALIHWSHLCVFNL